MLNVENQKMPVSAIIEEVLKINRLVEGGGSWCFYHGLQDVSLSHEGRPETFTYNIRGRGNLKNVGGKIESHHSTPLT